MSYSSLRVSHDDLGAMWITLDRPEAMNALDGATAAELRAALAKAALAEPTAVVIRGSGNVFCAGADLKWAREMFASGDSAQSRLLEVTDVFNELATLEVPTIAAVNGNCIAGGCELLLACDLAVAADHAMIGDGHANYGLLPGGGASVRLPLIIGRRHAARLLFLGDLVTAADAERIGLVNWVVPAADLDAKVSVIVAALYAKAPGGLRKMKRLLGATDRLSHDQALRLETELFLEHVGSHEAHDGLAAFAEKRRPAFRRGDAQ